MKERKVESKSKENKREYKVESRSEEKSSKIEEIKRKEEIKGKEIKEKAKTEVIHIKLKKKRSFFPFFLIILILIIAGVIVYLKFFYQVKCSDIDCFLENFKVCEKSIYVGDEWEYRILGITKKEGIDVCKVKVKNIGLINASADVAEKIKGKEMVCYIPMEKAGTYLPHKDIDPCTGELKEEILSIMLNKIYDYIIQHIGKIKIETSL